MTPGQFAQVVVALALGTLLEWYDFFVFSQLHATITEVFFPTKDPATAAISFWLVFFLAFLARPIGSVIFGHIGDTRGRRLTLLLSICIMAVPTVLIGCLPSYAQVGIAAPILLALLRLVQGLAMGGEFGSAVVYLHEVAEESQQSFVGSIGFASAISGCALGVLMVLVLETIFTHPQMVLFGWRLPFLFSIVSASAALALRMHMPEPHALLQEQRALKQRQLHVVAGYRRSSSSAGGIRRASTGGGGGTVSTTDPELGLQAAKQQQQHGAAAACHAPAAPSSAARAAAVPAADVDVCVDSSSHDAPKAAAASTTFAADGGCAHLPITMLLRWHWGAVLLQFLFEAQVSVGFYVLTTWLPMQMTAALGISVPLSRGMLIVNLWVCIAMQLLVGAACDRGLPRLWSAIGVFAVSGAITAPVLLYGMRPGALGACWVLHALLLALVGCGLGLVPGLSFIYPASVRASGFNLAHNMAMSWLGGLSPTVVTALMPVAVRAGSKFLAAAIPLVVAAGVSTLAALVLLWYAPAVNRLVDTRGAASCEESAAEGGASHHADHTPHAHAAS